MNSAITFISSKLNKKPVQYIVLAVASLLFTVLYVSLCFNKNIWTDEAFTIDLLNNYKTYGAIADYTATDVHPPLYYFILKAVTDIFGVRWTLIKLMSVVPMIMVFAMGITYVRKRFGFKSALLFIMLTGAIPCTMEYAVQMRMYAWCMAFVTGAAFSAYDAYETGRIRSFIGLLVCGVAAAYSHYFAFAAILWVHGILFIALLIKLIRGKKKQQKMPIGDADYGQSTSVEQCEEMCKVIPGRQLMFYITTALLSVIAYLPWVPKFLGQIGGVSGSYWIPEITWDVILDYFRWIFVSDYPGTVIICQILFGGCIVWLALSIVRNAVVRDAAVRNAVDQNAVAWKRVSSQADNRSQNSATTIYNNSICKNSPAVLALVIPILTIVTGIMLSLLIRPIFIIRYAMPCIPLLCFFAALMLSRLKAEHFVLLIVFLTSLTALDYKTNYRMEYKATDTDRTLEFFAQNLGENDVILYNYRVYDFIYWCYWPQDKMIYIDDLDYSAGYDHIWFIQTVYNPNPNPDVLAANGWTMQYMGDYGIEQNEFWLWDIHR